MNNCKWTPGPWFVIGEIGDEYTIRSRCYCDVCTILPIDDTANAHLIAASPELYSALDALISHPDDIMPSRLWDEARRVMEKARGESND